MNSIGFIKEEISKKYEIGVSRIVFNGTKLIEKLKTKKELRALVRNYDSWFKLALRDQSKRSTNELVTFLPIKKRSYKIYDTKTWKQLAKQNRPANVKIKRTNKKGAYDSYKYKINKLRSLRKDLKVVRPNLKGASYRRIRALIKGNVIDTHTKLNTHLKNVTQSSS